MEVLEGDDGDEDDEVEVLSDEWEMSDFDGDGDEDVDAFDNSGEEFGFNISMNSNSNSNKQQSGDTFQPPSLSKKKRALCNNLLKSLSKPLRKTPYVLNLHIRQKARIPIINFDTAFGIEVDVGIGGLAGVDTTAYAGMCVGTYGKLFSDVCLCVKILLVQRGYDKPFTGGIGSYKLYVMLAHHLDRVVGADAAKLGNFTVGVVLITFFRR